MDIELARTFLAVVETGSFLGAATRVHVTQSTVSMRIRSLEQQLGRPVFERGKSGATLTTAGRHFQRHAQTLVRTWTQARLDVGLPPDLEASLAIGAVPSLWEGFLIDTLPELASRIPSIAIKASIGLSDTLAQQLDNGTLDLAVMYRPKNIPGLTVEKLFEDPFVLVTSDPDPFSDPLGDGYILIDWGPEFRADHILNFPNLATPRLQLSIGTLGLRYFRKKPASGYFPRRVIAPEIQAGWLRLIDDAPKFAYVAYVVFTESDGDGFVAAAASTLQSIAKAQAGE